MESKLKEIIRILKKKFGMKIIVKAHKQHFVALIALNRGAIDTAKKGIFSKGIHILEYDEDGKIKMFSLKGMTVKLLSHEECG